MSLKESYCQQEIQQKQALLENAKKILKQEFVGIDMVIDKVIDSLVTWYLFPELQDRPVVINLWGMTGVGKTALVVRLANLLDYDKKFFRYDMGNNSKEYTSLKELLKGVFQHNNGIPYMIMLDEFQYAKTKNEAECEIDNHFSRVIWDLLDSGKFQSARDIDHQIDRLAQCKQNLSDCLAEGVKVSNGLVTKKREVFKEMVSQNLFEDLKYGVTNHNITLNGKPAYTFLPNNLYQALYTCLCEKNQTVSQFKRMINRMDGPQTIELLNKAIEFAKSNKWVDCTKTVIFILGNLDDAYSMASTLNPDINANEFHDASKLININHIKRALKSRFRYEQISRLGNNHIIYPAFSENSFKKIIELELSKVSLKTLERFKVKLIFAESFKSLIYREGVFATQGTRPLFSTIYQLVNIKIPMLIAEDLLNHNCADSVLFNFDEDHVNYEFSRDGHALYKIDDFIHLSMEKLRTPAKDDLQAITAVHESGHAVVAMKALKIIPEYICSTSADVSSRGFTLLKNKWKYLGKDEVIPRIANFLGGIVAERLIFGDNKITRGSEQDIELATDLAAKSIKDYGMGSLSASINTASHNSNYAYHDNKGEYNNEVKVLLQAAYTLAENILLSEKMLLLTIADYLSDERIIKREWIEKKVRVYGSSDLKNMAFIEEGDNFYYRNELKTQVQKIGDPVDIGSKTHIESIGETVISLNKKT